MRLRTRLVLLLLASNLAAIMWAGWQLYHNVEHELEEVLSAKLKTTSLTLLGVAERLESPDQPSIGAAFSSYIAVDNGWLRQFSGGVYHEETSELEALPDDFLVSVSLLDSTGQLIYQTSGATDFRFKFEGESGFNTVRDGEYQWLVHGRIDPPSGRTVFVAHRDDLRTYVSSEIVGDFVFEFMMLLPLMFVAIGLSVYWGLRPLEQLSSEIRGREAHNLDIVRLNGRLPREIWSIVHALNHLFTRLRGAFERERRFTSDAAHELRTPLAIIKTQADLLTTTESLDEAHQLGGELMQSTDRLSNLLNQLLMLARTEAEAQRMEMEPVQVNELLMDVVSSCLIDCGDQIEIVFKAPHAEQIRCYPPLAGQLFVNLIRNSVKYSPAGSEIELAVDEHDAEFICIRVADQGRGVPEADLKRIFQRFYRAEHTREDVEGAGLGLSIVHAIVKRHGWRIEARNRKQGGLEVLVFIPRAA